jgi:hypothetical protein
MIQAFVGLIFVFSAAHIVNYLVTGSRIERLDMTSCNASFSGFQTTTSTSRPIASTTSSSSMTFVTTTSTTKVPNTTFVLLTQEQINRCQVAQDWRHSYPGVADACYDLLVRTIVAPEDCCIQLNVCCPEP